MAFSTARFRFSSAAICSSVAEIAHSSMSPASMSDCTRSMPSLLGAPTRSAAASELRFSELVSRPEIRLRIDDREHRNTPTTNQPIRQSDRCRSLDQYLREPRPYRDPRYWSVPLVESHAPASSRTLCTNGRCDSSSVISIRRPSRMIDRMFAGRTGKAISPNMDYREWKALLAAAGIRNGRLHDARHTAATVLLLLGVLERAVMDSQSALTASDGPTYARAVRRWRPWSVLEGENPRG